MNVKTIHWLMLTLFTGALQASPLLYSIGADDSGIGRRFTLLDTNTNSATPLFDLGDGSLSFSGLTYDTSSDIFYAVRNDGFGNSTLVDFGLLGGGTYVDVMSLSTGGSLAFNGGLALDPLNVRKFYAIANDASPDSELFYIDVGSASITQLSARLGPGYTGGLTYNPGDGALYAVQNGFLSNSTLAKFDVSVNPAGVSATLPSFGAGFFGGLFPAQNGGFYALTTDAFGASRLNLLASDGNLTPLLAAGNGFYSAGLTSGAAAQTPEPSTFGLVLVALAGLALCARRSIPDSSRG
jgi:hypothetical protein